MPELDGPAEQCPATCKISHNGQTRDECVLSCNHEWDHVGLCTTWPQTEAEEKASTKLRLRARDRSLVKDEPTQGKTRERSRQPDDKF